MDGVLIVRKDAGPTSHDVVADVRRIFGQKKVGHTGTLDPMATGVLIVCLGKATRVVEYLVGLPKVYRARMVLGRETDTQDSTGKVIRERDASSVTREALGEAIARFVGEIEQVPPMVSALKHQGKPLYKLARQGRTVERAPRTVTIHSIHVNGFEPASETLAEAEITVRCSSGTYIRTLCADIGEALGCGAHMSALERTRVGRFGIEDAVTIERLRDLRSAGRLSEALMSINDALADMPEAVVDDDHADAVRHGRTVPVRSSARSGDTVRVVSLHGDLLAIGTLEASGETLAVVPGKVLDTGVPVS